MRMPTESELDELAQVAADGIHLPDAVHVPQPWACGTP
jgi:hypothetical protein